VHQADSIARAKRLVGWDHEHLKKTLHMSAAQVRELVLVKRAYVILQAYM
jgi:hypothetical protein